MKKWFSLVMSLFWAVLSIVGYFCWSWDLGKTIVFINLGFLSLFLNYYLTIIELGYKDRVVAAIQGRFDNPDLARPLVVIGKIFGFIGNVLLFTFAFSLVCIIAGGLIAVYFYKVLGVEDFEGFLVKWDREWTTVISFSAFLLIVEFVQFRLQFIKLNPYKITDWSAFLPFTKNTKYKLAAYLFGTVIIGCVDGLINDETHFGYISLIWLFICNFLWAAVDLYYPPIEIPLSEYISEE